MRFQRLTALAMAPILAGTLIACGSDGDGDDSSGADSKTLQERLFSSSGTNQAEQEKLVQECMTKQGFEYTPRDTRETVSTISIDPNSEDFVRERGFGISTAFLTEIDFSSLQDDPNSKYRESLSATQQAAYDKALYGNLPTIDGGSGGAQVITAGPAIAIGGSGPSDSGGGPSVQQLSVGGCLGEALEKTSADRPTFDAELFSDLQDLEKRIKSDPEMVEAMGKWSKCMADSGYQYRDRDQAMQEIREEFADLTGLELAGEGGVSFSVAGAVTTGEDGAGAFDPFANVDKEKLTALQEKEKRIALASLECSQEHVADVEAEVRERLEGTFLEEHPELKERAGS